MNTCEFVWLNKWALIFTHLSTNVNIRRLAKKFLNDCDKETMADSIVEKLISEAAREAARNPDDKFCKAILSSFRRAKAFHQEKCALSKWLSSTNGDENFNRYLLESKLAELENERQEILEAMKIACAKRAYT